MTASTSRRAALSALAALLALGVAPTSGAQDPRAGEAQQVARAWLAIADKLDADAAYSAAGPKFRSVLTLEKWREAMRQVRAPLGAMEQRTVQRTAFQTKLPGQPDGDYVLIAFRTAFARKPVSRELVSLERVDNRWLVVGYVIQ
jgi:hypothetical protein